MNIEQIIKTLHDINTKINEEKDYLTQLDNEIGDGDHGINLARGFSAVDEMLQTSTYDDVGTLLKNVAMKLISVVGGSAGPLYGTAFLRASSITTNKTQLNIEDFINCMDVAIEGVKFRGKSTQGEKTMLDAMIPALNQMKQDYANNLSSKDILNNAVKAAYDGVEYTKTIIATKGRASYIGERSIGHQDPGATSFTYILETIYKEL